MVDPSTLQNVPLILQQLPDLFFLSDLIFYVFGVLFFGSIAVKGFRGYIHFVPHLGLRVLMGLISMIGGLALAPFFPSLNQGLYALFRADILVGSLISSIILAAGLYLVSYRLINITALEKMVDNIRERIEKGKSLPKGKRGLKDPLKWVGIAVIIVFLGFSLMTFRGFPSISDSLLSSFGLSAKDLTDIGKQFGNLGALQEAPEGCESIISILGVTGPDITALPEATSNQAQSIIEQESSGGVVDMRIADVKGKEYVLAITDDSQICSVTGTQFCGCLDLSQFIG